MREKGMDGEGDIKQIENELQKQSDRESEEIKT